MTELQALLDAEASRRNHPDEVSPDRPDPILVARRFRQDDIALICALFSYGSATAIIRFLESLDFDLLSLSEETLIHELSGHYYRFQTSGDITALFLALNRLRRKNQSLESVFMEGFAHKGILGGIDGMIRTLDEYADRPRTRGWRFLLSQVPEKAGWKGASPLKRWMMFLRWMVRNDAIDMGLWKGISPRELIIPLDTHTFATSRKLGLLERTQYDLESARLLTEALRRFDPDDPVRYDFALYRLGQEKRL